MKNKNKILLAIASLLFATQFSFAATPDELIKAILAGDEATALSLIPGTDVNALSTDGNNALVSAAGFYPKITQALVDAKADVNYSTKQGLTPLYVALRWGNADAVKTLIAAGANVNQETMMGSAMLGWIYYPSTTTLKMMLDAGAKFKEPVKLMNVITMYPFLQYIKTVKTPAEMVAYYGSNKEAWLKNPVKFADWVLNPKASDFSTAEEIVNVFVEKGLDVNQIYETNKVKETALDAAMAAGLADAAKVLMDKGATYDPKKEMPMKDRYDYMKGNHQALFPTLTFTNGDYVLGAVMSDNLAFVKLMVEKNPKFVTKSYEGTGVATPCSYGNSLVWNYKVKGIDLLMIAAEHGNADIVKYLIEKGAGKKESVNAEWGIGHDKTAFCPMLMVAWTMRFARNSGKQEIIDIVKAAGHSKE